MAFIQRRGVPGRAAAAPAVITRRGFLGGSLACGLAACGGPVARRQPNIIVVLTDDQRTDSMSCHDQPSPMSFMRTPNMDRLAAEGLRFRNGFVTTSLCAPSRTTMMTGTYVQTHGVSSNEVEFPERLPTVAALLKQGGYETGFVGKWHVGRRSDAPRPEFDYWAGVPGQGRYVDPRININGAMTEVPGYSEEVFADLALEFIRRDRDQPFLLWLAHKAPHHPGTPPRHLETLYDDVTLELPATYEENHDDKPDWYLNCHNHDVFFSRVRPPERREKFVKDYARSLGSVDEQLGRIMTALDEKGVAEDTLVLYLGDNGRLLGEHRLAAKMLPYEESIRVPVLARWPGAIPEGQVNDDLVLNVDLAPTILDAAGLAAPDHMEGRAFTAQFRGETPGDWRQSFLYEYFNNRWGVPTHECVRTSDGWKYARYHDWEQLYYLEDDPTEINNLAQRPEFGTKKDELMAELRRLNPKEPELGPPGEYRGREHPPVRPPKV